ncbi:hypothetical protein [uncultured Brevundimonas sp.]|uniref:hypothetical protein n=1 Tax=uncultured Brevundimonas sp. TaxID=213418 RepID=UPI002606D426|nr:hypothetical protein [uncultured Brevundimonas sp.]
MLGAARLNSALMLGDPAAEAYIAAAGITDPTRQGLVRDFFAATKAIRAKCDGMWLLAAGTSLASRVCLVNPSHVLTVEEIYVPPYEEYEGYYVSPDFTADRGWSGNFFGGSYDVAGLYLASLPLTHYQEDDGHLAFYGPLSGSVLPTAHIGGWRQGGPPAANVAFLATSGSNTTYAGVTTTSVVSQVSAFAGRHLITATRGIAANVISLFRGATNYGGGASTANVTPGATIPLYVATAYAGSNNNQAFASIGANLSAGELTTLNDALTTYLTAIGGA